MWLRVIHRSKSFWLLPGGKLFNTKIHTYIHPYTHTHTYIHTYMGGNYGVIVIIVQKEHDNLGSNPRQGFFTFSIMLIPLGKLWIQLACHLMRRWNHFDQNAWMLFCLRPISLFASAQLTGAVEYTNWISADQ